MDITERWKRRENYYVNGWLTDTRSVSEKGMQGRLDGKGERDEKDSS